MIREFWTENYLSIQARQTMSFEVDSSDADSWLCAEVAPGIKISRIGIVFGANASGKSNVLKAIQNVFELMFVSRSNRNESVHSEQPFALTPNDPTKMFVSFYADGIRYDYSIEYNQSYIIREELLYYPNRSKSLFYERDFVADDSQCNIKFGTSVGIKVKTLSILKENTLNNHSVLSTFSKTSLPDDAVKIARLYNWIKSHVHGVGGNTPDLTELLKSVSEDKRKKHFYLEMLKKADFNISDFNVSHNGKEDKIEFVNTSSGRAFVLPAQTQSAGTIKYLYDLAYLYEVIDSDHIYMLDELGEDLHYDLLLYYIQVFLANSSQSQLFFTSQEMTLLSEDQFNKNRETVWFVEKSPETASSEYTRADKLGLHKNNSLYNSYRIGRFGAKPYLGSPFIFNKD